MRHDLTEVLKTNLPPAPCGQANQRAHRLSVLSSRMARDQLLQQGGVWGRGSAAPRSHTPRTPSPQPSRHELWRRPTFQSRLCAQQGPGPSPYTHSFSGHQPRRGVPALSPSQMRKLRHRKGSYPGHTTDRQGGIRLASRSDRVFLTTRVHTPPHTEPAQGGHW